MTSTPTTQFTDNKNKITDIIENIQLYIEKASDNSEDTMENIKSHIEKKRHEGMSAYHEILADVYSKTDAGGAELKTLEHTLKSMGAKAKALGLDLGLELKEKIENL